MGARVGGIAIKGPDSGKKPCPGLKILIPLAFMGIILLFTLQPGTESVGLSRRIAHWLVLQAASLTQNPSLAESDSLYAWIHTLVRKSGHFFEYFLLYLLFHMSFRAYKSLAVKHLLLVFGFVVCFAFLDEWVQSLIPGRESRLTDVLIDAFGAFLAMAAIFVIQMKAARKNKKVKTRWD